MSVNVLPMDHYLRSVVPSEMTSSWSTAALQAQAVAARTFAAYQRAHVASGSLYDTCDSTACQVYKGRRGYSSTGTVSTYETTATTNAVVATSGLAMYYGGGLALTQFSASNGGRTVASSLAYQVSKTDPYDAVPSGSPSRWSTTIPVTKIESTYPSTGRLKALRITKRDGISTWGGRISSVAIIGASGSTTVTGDAFRTAMGLRSVWWTVTSAPAVSAASFPKDLDGNSLGDVLAVDPSGRLELLSGNGKGGFTAKVIGSGWGGVGLVTNAGAWDGDNRHDVLARSSGTLYSYPSNGKGGFFPPVAVSSGWAGTDLLTSPGDFDGNGHTDLLSRTASTGELRLHRGNGKGGIFGSSVIGPGWNAFRLIAAGGDLTGDGKQDVVAVRSSDGTMVIYPGTGTGWFSAPVPVSGSWAGYTAMAGPGDVTGDGRDDLVARRASDGALVVFAGNDLGHLTPSSVASGTTTWASWTRWTP
jgi:SpoIID/LytB domain protein